MRERSKMPPKLGDLVIDVAHTETNLIEHERILSVLHGSGGDGVWFSPFGAKKAV
jgi:hypothetical protein